MIPEEELILIAGDVMLILRDAGFFPRLGEVHYDRMGLPFVWISWKSSHAVRPRRGAPSIIAQRRQRLRISWTRNNFELVRWALGERQAEGYWDAFLSLKRQAEMGQGYLSEFGRIIGPYDPGAIKASAWVNNYEKSKHLLLGI